MYDTTKEKIRRIVRNAEKEISHLTKSNAYLKLRLYHIGEEKVKFILFYVSKYYDKSIDDLKGRERKRKFVDVRKIYSKIAKENSNNSLDAIASKINRPHEMVLFYIKECEKHIDTDEVFRKNYEAGLNYVLNEIRIYENKNGKLRDEREK